MLTRLSIRDCVLIKELDLDFKSGLSVLTGETGAGKSILLDSMGLALGDRGETGLIRNGAEKLSVTAGFEIPKSHPVLDILDEHDIDFDDDELIIRRNLRKDGRGKAYINDQPISVRLLKKIGQALVEIHGQFESHSLMNPATHRSVLDAYGRLENKVFDCSQAYKNWQSKKNKRIEAENALAQAKQDEELLRFQVDELEKLAPTIGEEESLTEQRNMLMHGEKILEGMNSAYANLTQKFDVDGAIRKASANLERIAEKAEGKLDPVIDMLDQASININEILINLRSMSDDVDLDPKHQEEVEERLFALKAMARKHNVTVDELPNHFEKLKLQLAQIDKGDADIIRLTKEEEEARRSFENIARTLSNDRKQEAEKLAKAVMEELPPLKLGNAKFVVDINELSQKNWSEHGMDQIAFLIATNPGLPPSPIHKTASGGELSRFMLALKVNLAKTSPVSSIVFDEVDSGIGGATAAAVGERLSTLGENLQVLVVTHSPQVASLGKQHLRVEKNETDGVTTTSVRPLDHDERLEEIARMLAGEEITLEARQAAKRLLK